MISTNGLYKSFGEVEALKDLTLSIRDGRVFGLIGTNGAGKSTLLRIISGVLKPDKGDAFVDGKPVFDAPDVKRDLFFIPDDPYFFPNSTAEDMRRYYSSIYPAFDRVSFDALLIDFGLDPARPVRNYSKGMKKQLAVICGISSGVRHLLCDETFDGLDPVMRQAVKSSFAGAMDERGLSPVIASHNLRELEDICDHVGLLHQGGLLLSEELESMKLGIQKVQCVFEDEQEEEKTLSGLKSAGLSVADRQTRGRLHTYVIRGERDAVMSAFRDRKTLFFELLPLTLEEIFICETEVAGYDVKKLILN